MKNSWKNLENNKIIQEEVNNEFFFLVIFKYEI